MPACPPSAKRRGTKIAISPVRTLLCHVLTFWLGSIKSVSGIGHIERQLRTSHAWRAVVQVVRRGVRTLASSAVVGFDAPVVRPDGGGAAIASPRRSVLVAAVARHAARVQHRVEHAEDHGRMGHPQKDADQRRVDAHATMIVEIPGDGPNSIKAMLPSGITPSR